MMGYCCFKSLIWVLLVFLFVVLELLGGVNGRVIEQDVLGSTLQKRKEQDQGFQQAAFQAFDHHKTGEVYNVPSSSSSSIAQAVRLRSGSLRRYGLLLHEFDIPPGCQIHPSPERVLLVYQHLGSSDLFPLPGYVLVGPVVGISVYDSSNLSASQPLPKLSLAATLKNISLHLQLNQPLPANVTSLCASFEENSLRVTISNLTSSGVCSVQQLGFFSLIAEPFARPPAPVPAPSPVGTPSVHGRRSKTWKILVGAIVGALAMLALLSILVFSALKYRRHQRLAVMENQADLGETLQTTSIRNSRAPAAGATRTHPMLENEYVS